MDLKTSTIKDLDPNGEPDIVILADVIEHFSDPVDELNKIWEICDSKATVYINTPGIKYLSPFREYYSCDFLKMLQFAHTFYFTSRTLTNVMNVTGFESIHVDESIEALFKVQQGGVQVEPLQSDYPEVVNHLNKCNLYRHFCVSKMPEFDDLYKNPYTIWILKKTGTYNIAKRIFRWVQ